MKSSLTAAGGTPLSRWICPARWHLPSRVSPVPAQTSADSHSARAQQDRQEQVFTLHYMLLALRAKMWPGTRKMPEAWVSWEGKVIAIRPSVGALASRQRLGPSDPAIGLFPPSPALTSPARLPATSPALGEGLRERGQSAGCWRETPLTSRRLPRRCCREPRQPRLSSRRWRRRNPAPEVSPSGTEETDVPGRGTEGDWRQATSPDSAYLPPSARPAQEEEGSRPARPIRGGVRTTQPQGWGPDKHRYRRTPVGLWGLSRRWARVRGGCQRPQLPLASTAISWPPAAGTGGSGRTTAPAKPRAADPPALAERPGAPGQEVLRDPRGETPPPRGRRVPARPGSAPSALAPSALLSPPTPRSYPSLLPD